jgi:hypothetical protein
MSGFAVVQDAPLDVLQTPATDTAGNAAALNAIKESLED